MVQTNLFEMSSVISAVCVNFYGAEVSFCSISATWWSKAEQLISWMRLGRTLVGGLCTVNVLNCGQTITQIVHLQFSVVVISHDMVKLHLSFW